MYKRCTVGYVEKITVKRCYKYKMVKVKMRFTKEYENTYKKRGGANITIIRNGRQYFFRMFDPDLGPQELRNRYGWQTCKKISIESNATDGEIINEIWRIFRKLTKLDIS